HVNAVTQVGLGKGDGTHTTLKKDGAGWSVGERGWPADPGKVRKLLLDLGALNIVEEKTRLPANYPQLGVQDVSSPKATGTRIEVITPGESGRSSSASPRAPSPGTCALPPPRRLCSRRRCSPWMPTRRDGSTAR